MEIGPGGFVVTDESCRTTLDGVFAAGDVAGPPLLAHWAYHQGADRRRERGDRLAASNCDRSAGAQLRRSARPRSRAAASPRTRPRPRVSTHEVAHVRFNGNSKAVCDGDDDGFVRIVCEPGGGKVLGASLIGPHVTELVHELALAVHSGLTLGRHRRHHPRPPDALRGDRGGRAGRRRARRPQHLSRPATAPARPAGAGRPARPQAGVAQAQGAGAAAVPRHRRPARRARAAHRVPRGALPQQGRVLRLRHGDVPDPRRRVHARVHASAPWRATRRGRAGAAWRPRPDEPRRVAEAARRLGLRHVVVTSVTRDDLPDGGAAQFAAADRRRP